MDASHRSWSIASYRSARITWTVCCGIACVLLIVLWVRSYRTLDAINIVGGHRFWLLHGYVYIDETFEVVARGTKISTQNLFGYSIQLIGIPLGKASPRGFGNKVPVWALIIAVTALAAVPWIRRFSLRTLLIATTLVA
jgi:hypothetical protein